MTSQKLIPMPAGYSTWLDYAVDTMDARGVCLETMFADRDDRAGITQDDVRAAARAELDELRASIALQPAPLRQRKKSVADLKGMLSAPPGVNLSIEEMKLFGEKK